MPVASRITDIGLGHESFIETPIIKGSPDVITGSSPQARQGDALLDHKSKSKSKPHPRALGPGSGTVFINSKSAIRIGDPVVCGGLVGSGFGTVIIGG